MSKPGTRLVALYDFAYAGDKPEFASFKKDEIFTFVSVANADWWSVKTSRK